MAQIAPKSPEEMMLESRQENPAGFVLPNQEKIASAEKSAENISEVNKAEKISEGKGTQEFASAPIPAVFNDAVNKETEKEVEKILTEGLEDIYIKMPPDKQAVFKTAGEAAVKKISVLIASAKLNLGKIISIIKSWLILIPGANRLFVEQEAKIKADEIMKLK